MDPMAKYVTREGGGGLGDVIRGIIVELHARDIEGFYIGPNYKKIFKNNSMLTKDEYIRKVHCSKKNQVVLLSSKHFSYLNRIYDGNTTLSAALMQDLALPYIKSINSDRGKRAIVHTHDQSVGIIPAYCKSRGIPIIHTVHNAFTYTIPYEYYPHADLTGGEMGLKKYLYNTSWDSQQIDSHATAVKNADVVTFVGKSFLEEILEGRFDNWNLFAGARNTFNEIKIKSHFNQNRVIMNGISSVELPENQAYLTQSFGPNTLDIIGAKKQNLVEFQKSMGLNINKDAILLYWPSRIDENQKGIESLLNCALFLLHNHPNIQIAIVGDDSSPEKKYIPYLNSLISMAPKGQIAHRPFEKKLSNQGYASSSIIIGASHYEPFGLFWLQGVCAGAFGVGANNGGAVDILRELEVEKNHGNGFFYKTPNAEGLKQGLQNAIVAVKQLQKNPKLYNTHLRRMMIDARRDFSTTKMIESYIEVYERLGLAYNLFTEGHKHFSQSMIRPLKLTGS